MPRVAIAEQTLNSRTGAIVPASETTGDNPNGHFFVWGPNKILSVRNTSGSAWTITFTPQMTGLPDFVVPLKQISVPANATMLFGPFPSVYMHGEDNDRVWVDVGSSSLMLAVINSAEA
jgi:hypothetical protein